MSRHITTDTNAGAQAPVTAKNPTLNRLRRARALALVSTYGDIHDRDSATEALIDLLADLAHWTLQRNIDFLDCAHIAEAHAECEVAS